MGFSVLTSASESSCEYNCSHLFAQYKSHLKLKVRSIFFVKHDIFNKVKTCFAKVSRRKSLNNLKRATLQDPLQENLCDGVIFNEIAGINSRPRISAKEKPPSGTLSCEYIRTFSASTGRSSLSSAFLIKLRIAYYRTATLIRRWFTIGSFLEKRHFLFFLRQTVFGTCSKKNLW